MSTPTFETAAEVFEDTQTEQGKAMAAYFLNPSHRTEQAMLSANRATGEAARFAAKNPAPLLDRANNAPWIETKTGKEI